MIPLPAHASVVVIGGGVMGCSTLYHLAQMGVSDAVLLERHQLTSGTTWHSAAQVRALRSSRNMTELVKYSIDLYSRLEAETGQSVGWIKKGSLSVACNEARLTHIRRQESLAHLYGVRAQSVSVDEAKARWELMNADDVIGAVWSPDDGRVNPSDLCAALVKGAKAAGANIFEQTSVTGIQTQNGKVTGVSTVHGDIRCDAVAVCAGLWSREVAAKAGAAAPLWPCEHFYLLTKPIDEVRGNLPTLSDHDSHLYIRDEGGGLLIGCFEPHARALPLERMGDDSAFKLLPEDWEHFEPMMAPALARVPALAQAEVRLLLNGAESFTPDGAFLLGETAETEGLFLGCGMNSVGVATGGGAGHALAHCIAHGHPPFALPEIDPKRFHACYNSVPALTARAPEILGRHYEIGFPGRQYATARNLRIPPLTEIWRGLNAHFGQFYGWERPLYFNKQQEPHLTFARPEWFAQVGREVEQAHQRAAVFDLSTLGKIAVCGADAEYFLNRVCTNNLCRVPGRLVYTLMLNVRGGIESDLTAFRLTADSYRLYTGTAAVARDVHWLKRQRRDDERVKITDETEQWAVIALCGAQAAAIAAAIGASDWNMLPFFSHQQAVVNGVAVSVARLSYVGEAGWEITCRAEDASAVYATLAAAGATPAGVFAQSAMRVEKGFIAYGHDVDSDVTPLEAGVERFAVDWNSDFIGKDALRAGASAANKTRRIVSIVFDDDMAHPIGGEPVFVGGNAIGQTTSAAYGYRIQRPVAIAFIETEALPATDYCVTVDIAGKQTGGRVLFGAAFDIDGKRMKKTIIADNI